MPWIKEIAPKDNAQLKEIYDQAEARTKEKTANVLKIHSLDPEMLKAHMRLYETVMFKDGALTKEEREMLGVVVSKANECPYCVTHHANAFYAITSDKKRMRAIAEDYTKALISPKARAMCDYAFKLTQTPYKMVETDVTALKDHGLSDTAILETNQVVAYFNYVNRIVHGLGVELETQI